MSKSWIGRVLLCTALALAMAVPALAVQVPTVAVKVGTANATAQKVAARPALVSAGQSDTTEPLSTKYVYITKSGSKYHRTGCRYLRSSKIKKTLKWARSHGYGACKVCKPPKK